MRRALVGAEGQEKLKANDCPVFSGVGERYSRTPALFQLSRSKDSGIITLIFGPAAEISVRKTALRVYSSFDVNRYDNRSTILN